MHAGDPKRPAVSAEEQVRVEAELARRLAAAGAGERQQLYGEVYDRIYEMHFSRSPEILEFGARMGFRHMLLKLSSPGAHVLEVGCGAGLLAIELAKADREVIGLEVSEVILDRARERAAGVSRVSFKRTDGVALPFPDATFDFAYSIEVLEHLHESDAKEHLAEVARVLRPGGRYWLMTPTPLDTRDASERFGVDVEVDADVHLKEWTYAELKPVLREAGFARVTVPLRDQGALGLPFLPIGLFATLERLPKRLLRPRVLDRLGLTRISLVAHR